MAELRAVAYYKLNKYIYMFKEGEFIKIKPNTKLESGEIVNNWAGEIKEVYADEKCCLVILDAQTIDALDDAYLKASIDEGAEPFEYVFEFDDLEPGERRDTDELAMKAMENLSSRILAIEGENEIDIEALNDKLIGEFENTEQFESLNTIQKENVNFVISTFMDFMYNYEYVQPQEWSPTNVQSVCLDIVPRKISADEEAFENYGDVLISYLNFLGSKNYISNSEPLIQTVEKIKQKIPVQAKNPENWGMAKSILMPAHEQGFDMSSEEDLQKFMILQQARKLNEIRGNNQSKIIPSREDPFKEIGRNQKITIQYSDGRILENIKFKKVESDLRDGKCEIVQ